MFNKGEGGFKDRDLYVSCANASDGIVTAHAYSKEWDNAWDNAPVPHSILYMKDGHAIHGSYEVKHLGKARHVAACDSRRSNNALHAGREDGTEEYPGRACRRHSRRGG